VNGNKLQVPVMADGVLALSLGANGKSGVVDEKLKSKVSAEYGFLGTSGRITLFGSDLSDREIAELQKTCVVVRFS